MYYYYNGVQWYKQFLQIGRREQALISLSSEHLCVIGLHGRTYVYFFVKFFILAMAIDVVDEPLLFSAVTLLVGSSDL